MVQFSVVHEPLIWIGIVKFCGIGMVYTESEHYCGLFRALLWIVDHEQVHTNYR
jgi:hypothetical protein